MQPIGKDRPDLSQKIFQENVIPYTPHRWLKEPPAQLLLQTRTTVFERRIFLSLKPAPPSSPTKSEKVKVTTLIFLRQQSQHFEDRDFSLTLTLSHTQQTITQYKHFVLCYLCLGSSFMICPSSLCNSNFKSSRSETQSWSSPECISPVVLKDNDFRGQVFPGSCWPAGGVDALGIAWGT